MYLIKWNRIICKVDLTKLTLDQELELHRLGYTLKPLI